MDLINRCTVIALTWMLVSTPVGAAEREVVKTDWSGFQKEVSTRRLSGRSVRIVAAGKDIKTDLIDVLDNALVVRPTRGTKPWDDKIPRDQVASVRFNGRTGKRGTVGALVGLGAGAGIGAGIASGSTISEDYGFIYIPLLTGIFAAGGGVAGFFIGRSTDTLAPEFVLTK
jgi:hypothetical protein